MSKSRRISSSHKGLQVHELRAAGIGHVGDVAAIDSAGQVPDQPGIDIAEQHIAGSRLLAGTGHVSSSQRSFSPEK